ncbi:hypothetical protein DFQ27_008908 [Actinomortierella ambigua]|uniref:Rhodanese domain-containing protein n=1 Tax=Actinomortierella ambigua TaxID=1343610 RepID=A0A9P6TXC0_9FUNG|nr:hypothetical protein DFQ27_008908 [Actinomortierella ambigua]
MTSVLASSRPTHTRWQVVSGLQQAYSTGSSAAKTPKDSPLAHELYRTLTFYTLTPTAIPRHDLERLREQLWATLTRYRILGRVYLSGDGINLHLCAPIQHIEDLQRTIDDLVLSQYGKGIDGAIWNFSTQEATTKRVFRKLKVQVKKQLVADGRLGDWDIQSSKPPTYLEPEAWHRRLDLDAQGLDAHGHPTSERALLVDMRNHFENEVGTFKTAVKMDCTTFRENMDLLDELVKNRDKNKEILMVCTGGIRCSVSGRYLRQQGFTDVKMLKGGITSYGRYVKSQQHQEEEASSPETTTATASHFIGKNFTFDGRRGERITADIIAHCQQCHTPHDDFSNCANSRCHLLFIQCPACRTKWNHTCGPECKEAVENGTGPAAQKPYDYHAQVRPDLEPISKAA